MVLYDSLATIADERQYVWKAQHSIGKYAFLLNRFLVASVCGVWLAFLLIYWLYLRSQVMLATLHGKLSFDRDENTIKRVAEMSGFNDFQYSDGG